MNNLFCIKVFFIGLIATVFIPNQAAAQNLVSNGSFEKFTQCPEDFAKRPSENMPADWESPNYATPDYFNACSYKCGVPHNWAGSADAYHGNAYLGIIGCMQQFDRNQIAYREYIRTILTTPLIEGQKYIATMQVRLASSCNTACNGLGMYFSATPNNSAQTGNYPFIPQVDTRTKKPFADKEGWSNICGVFTARGDEKFLIIGNFLSDQEVNHLELDENFITTQVITRSAYYYIDKVEVFPFTDSTAVLCTEDLPQQVAEFKGLVDRNDKLVLANLYFETDKAQILSKSYYELDRLVDALIKKPQLKIKILGHTDNTGTPEHNIGLSSERAIAVQNYLVAKGISKFRITSEGLGQTLPIADNDTEEGRAANRRVEIEVY